MTSTTTLELATTLDWGKGLETLANTPTVDLATLLSGIDTYPAPAKPKKSKMPASTELSDDQTEKLNKLPEIFRQVQTPATRREFNQVEQAKLAEERATLDDIIKFCTDRKAEINEMISTHFDVVAEKGDLVSDRTGVDGKGHYLIAAPGVPERSAIRDLPMEWVRQRSSDQTVPNPTKLTKLHQAGAITDEEYKAVTKPVSGRVFDEEKVRKLLLSAKNRETAQRVLNLISDQKRGTNSIWLRKN